MSKLFLGKFLKTIVVIEPNSQLIKALSYAALSQRTYLRIQFSASATLRDKNTTSVIQVTSQLLLISTHTAVIVAGLCLNFRNQIFA
jgi:hypothetical protein